MAVASISQYVGLVERERKISTECFFLMCIKLAMVIAHVPGRGQDHGMESDWHRVIWVRLDRIRVNITTMRHVKYSAVLYKNLCLIRVS